MEDYSDYEGAGVLLLYEKVEEVKGGDIIKIDKFVILGVSHASKELEFIGGKREGDETPKQTATNEVYEETGGFQADLGADGVRIVRHFQPLSKKWIWNHVVHLTDAEYADLSYRAARLDQWKQDEKRNYAAFTGRVEFVKKGLDDLIAVPLAEFRQ